MNKMEAVMSIRLPRQDLEVVEKIAYEEDIDKSTAVRELVEMGRIYFALSRYKEGKASIGKAAEIANLSLSEFMDLVAGLGIPCGIDVKDYLEGAKVAEKIFK